nr:immunoglobulin heavy chain junction region [Macaca mulatta]
CAREARASGWFDVW